MKKACILLGTLFLAYASIICATLPDGDDLESPQQEDSTLLETILRTKEPAREGKSIQEIFSTSAQKMGINSSQALILHIVRVKEQGIDEPYIRLASDFFDFHINTQFCLFDDHQNSTFYFDLSPILTGKLVLNREQQTIEGDSGNLVESLELYALMQPLDKSGEIILVPVNDGYLQVNHSEPFIVVHQERSERAPQNLMNGFVEEAPCISERCSKLLRFMGIYISGLYSFSSTFFTRSVLDCWAGNPVSPTCAFLCYPPAPCGSCYQAAVYKIGPQAAFCAGCVNLSAILTGGIAITLTSIEAYRCFRDRCR